MTKKNGLRVMYIGANRVSPAAHSPRRLRGRQRGVLSIRKGIIQATGRDNARDVLDLRWRSTGKKCYRMTGEEGKRFDGYDAFGAPKQKLVTGSITRAAL